MQINNRKKYDIFFCHPSGDRRKATLIVNFFLKQIIREALGDKYSIFYSPEDLKKDRESKAWLCPPVSNLEIALNKRLTKNCFFN